VPLRSGVWLRRLDQSRPQTATRRSGATLIIQENFQPTFEVRKVIEHLLDNAEKSEQFTEELDGKLDAARENERELKEENAE